MLKTSNPILQPKRFSKFENYATVSSFGSMTLNGTINKIGILLFLVVGSASWIWYMAGGISSSIYGFMIIGLIVGLILSFITIFRPQISHITAPIYAISQGLFIGGLSSLLEMQYPGIVIQAVWLTFGTMIALLFAYKSGMIAVTDKFKLGIFASTAGIGMIYFISMFLSFFGIHLPFIYQGGFLGIGFSMFVVVIASLNLVLDFDFIEKASLSNAPKYMEWFGAFGLIVTLIWLYMEIIRLLMKLRSRN